MYYAGRLERRYGLRFRMAVAMENQTLPCGLASLWAGAGARWSWRTDFADLPCVATGAVHVADLSTGQETPSQMVTNDGGRALRILARQIPSVGYKVFEVFMDMTGTNAGARVGVTLANADCYFAQLGNSTAGTLDTTTAQLAVLAGGQVDGAGLGILSQGEDTHFLQRFALQTHDAYDAVAAMQFALEFQNPLVTGTITGGSAYPATNYSHICYHRNRAEQIPGERW